MCLFHFLLFVQYRTSTRTRICVAIHSVFILFTFSEIACLTTDGRLFLKVGDTLVCENQERYRIIIVCGGVLLGFLVELYTFLTRVMLFHRRWYSSSVRLGWL